jgi:hypothetical protein
LAAALLRTKGRILKAWAQGAPVPEAAPVAWAAETDPRTLCSTWTSMGMPPGMEIVTTTMSMSIPALVKSVVMASTRTVMVKI